MGKQLSLFRDDFEYGGVHRLGKAKIRRPLSTKRPLHVTLKSSKAQGAYSLGRHRPKINQIMKRQADKWGVRVYRLSINSNHIHLAMRGTTRQGIQNFFRCFSGLVARAVTKAEKSRPFGKFWDRTLWTRVAHWGEAFHSLKGYVVRNLLESTGQIPYDRSIPTATILRL